MNALVPKNAKHVIGVLNGWDRLVFRGTLRMLAFAEGMAGYLSRIGTLLKDFGDHAQAMTKQLIEASLQRAEAAGRPVKYLPSSKIRKDEYARQIARQDGITEGLICVLECVEPCRSFEIYRNREKKILELVARDRKCKFLYHYWIDPRFGFMSARVQSWFPFSLQVCMNGREWLARRMDEQGLAYTRYDNSFPWIEDFPKAQKMFDGLLKTDWPKALQAAARQVHPAHGRMFRGLGFHYYWSAFQTEWATDTVFDSPQALAAIYPQLVRGAIATFDSRSVMRFLGHRLYENHEGEIVSDYRSRPEGVCVKHRAMGNSIKVYDKGGSILRVETTINNPAAYRSYRCSETEPEGEKQWRTMRRGVADMYRRAEVSQAANDRYAEALAALDTTTPLGQLAAAVCRPVTKDGKRYRALHPFAAEDRALLEAISDGKSASGGFCNRDLASRLYPAKSADKATKGRIASKVSYRLRILRAHGLIRKSPGQRRYHMTTQGRQIVTALLQVQHTTLQQLNALAA
jgi:hypothetical protein